MKIVGGGKSKKMNSAKMKNKLAKAKAKTKKGNPSKHGKDRIGSKEDFAEEKILTKAIDKANEAKCAAKYGDAYQEYLRRVPWRILPGVF